MKKSSQSLSYWTDIIENQILDTSVVRIEDIRNAFDHITEEQDKGLYGLCNYYMAYYDLKNGKTDECLDYLKESIRCMVGTPQEINVARCYNILGILAHGQNNLLMAAEQYNKALVYTDKYQDHFIRNIVISNMADMYFRVGAYDRGFECFRESMAEYSRSGDDSATGAGNYMMLLSNYGYYLCRAKRLDEANQMAEKLYSMQDGVYAEQFPRLYAYTFLALLCHEHKEKDKALDFLIMAVQEATVQQQLAGDFDGIFNLLELLVMMEEFGLLGEVLDSVEPLAVEENNDSIRLHLLFFRLKYCKDGMTQQEYMDSVKEFFRIKEEQGSQEIGLVLHMLEVRRRLWDIEETQKALETENTKLLYQVDHDQLSGLYNKGCLNRYAEEAFDRALKTNQTLSVIFVDIDYFKQLNDFYGHQRGDECIQAVAECIRQSVPEDFAARYGGDEFVVIAVGRSESYIRSCAENIVDSVRKKNISNENSAAADVLTVTVGLVHTVPKKPNKVWDFMAAADEALYKQKKEKRGCVRVSKRRG